MSDKIDTSAEAVERLAFESFTANPTILSGTLRALVEERDDLRERIKNLETENATLRKGWNDCGRELDAAVANETNSAIGAVLRLREQAEREKAEVERLRERAESYRKTAYDLAESYRKTANNLAKRLARAETEVERLREALDDIAEVGPEEVWPNEAHRRLANLVRIARAALRNEGGDDD